MYQFEVRSIFLNGDLQKEVYVYSPKDFTKGEEHKVCKLRKVLINEAFVYKTSMDENYNLQ